MTPSCRPPARRVQPADHRLDHGALERPRRGRDLSQQIPVRRIGLADLEAAPIDWEQFSLATPEVMPVTDKKKLRPHQLEAVADVTAGFTEHDRGKLIMASGTGTTFTSLRLAEQLGRPAGRSCSWCPRRRRTGSSSGGVEPFDLIVSDEAHRTTGMAVSGQDKSAFVRDAAYLARRKRLCT